MADGLNIQSLFEPETGQRIQRFGAALGGRLSQFDVAQSRQREERRQLSAERRKALLADNRDVRRRLEAGDTAGATARLQSRVENIGRLGGDPKDTLGLLNQLSNDPKGALREVTLLDQRAVDEGLLPKFERPEAPKPISGKSIVDGQVVVPDGKGGFKSVQVTGFETPEGGEPDKVRSSNINPTTGLVIQSTDSGINVVTAGGKRLTGQAAVNAVEKSAKATIKAAGDTAAARTIADRIKQNLKVGGEAFKSSSLVRKTLLTITRARQALAEGAETGPILKLLPSIQAASIKLDNIMNQLGLEVVGGVTFGALSAGELRLALDTALPTGLQPKELDEWLAAKSAAQKKLLIELETDAITLLDPEGGGIASIIRRRQTQRQGGDLPDGVTEEDITETMRANNMTREQVLQRLRGQ